VDYSESAKTRRGLLPDHQLNVSRKMTISVVEETFEIKKARISVSILSLKDALMILVTDLRNEYRIGNIALATPIADKIGETMPSVAMLLGTGGELLAKVLARRASAKTGRISLSIVGLRETDSETASSIVKAAERIMEKIKDENLHGRIEARK
jgi:hypothetical protein